MTALLQISSRMGQLTNFENRTVFDEVMCRLRWLTFLAHPVYRIISGAFLGDDALYNYVLLTY